jgi:HlyD family secretion protein
MALSNPMWVRAYVSESDLGKVAPGMKVSIFTDSAPGNAYAGTIGYVSPVAEFTPKTVETPDLRTDLVYRLRVVVDHPDAALRQGMPVTVTAPLSVAGGATGAS